MEPYNISHPEKDVTVNELKDAFLHSYLSDLSKVFDNVDHKNLITKLENYGVKGTHLRWFKGNLESRKQFITYENFSTSHINISCGLPQDSIFAPL